MRKVDLIDKRLFWCIQDWLDSILCLKFYNSVCRLRILIPIDHLFSCEIHQILSYSALLLPETMNCRFVVFEFIFTKLWTKEHGHFCFFFTIWCARFIKGARDMFMVFVRPFIRDLGLQASSAWKVYRGGWRVKKSIAHPRRDNWLLPFASCASTLTNYKPS